jgi:DNA replication and repair protein RecF
VRVEQIEVWSFRNHAGTSLKCAERVNVLVGNNGEGKTNLAEAVSVACLTKSFYAGSDSVLVRRGDLGFRVVAEFVSDGDTRYRLEVAFDAAGGRKSVVLNRKPVERLTDIVGKFPIVVLSPEQIGITSGTPAERRRFVDTVMSQASGLYVEDLLAYRRILKQRNRVLLDGKLGRGAAPEALAAWDEQLITVGSRVVERRSVFVREFEPYVVAAYNNIGPAHEIPKLKYCPGIEGAAVESGGEIARAFRGNLEERRWEEQRIGSTLVGPHRDEILLELGPLEVRTFASQGQHKTYLIALKLAEFEFLRERAGDLPIVVLDDVFSELDRDRTQRVLEILDTLGQTFVTLTDDSVFREDFFSRSDTRRFRVHQGTCMYEEATKGIGASAR